jgi:hypothetical protein
MLLLDIQSTEHPFRNAFIIWSLVVLVLVMLTRYVNSRDRAAQQLDPAAAQQANLVREQRQQQRSDAPAPPGGAREAPDDCPICLAPPSFSVDTNCSHQFCAACFLQYWNQGGGGIARSKVKCPCW